MDEQQPGVELGAEALADLDVSADAAAEVTGGAEPAGAEPLGKTDTIIEK